MNIVGCIKKKNTGREEIIIYLYIDNKWDFVTFLIFIKKQKVGFCHHPVGFCHYPVGFCHPLVGFCHCLCPGNRIKSGVSSFLKIYYKINYKIHL
jgi:hypothetical protein